MKEVKEAISTPNGSSLVYARFWTTRTDVLCLAKGPHRNSRPVMRLCVVYNGFGMGRDAFNAAILSSDGAFVRGLIGQVGSPL